MMVMVQILHPRGLDLVGFIPEFLDERDPRPAKEQFNENYAHGGGWFPFEGFTMNPASGMISYPGDPAYKPVAAIGLRDETIYVYEHAWVAIVQKDGSYEIARMD